MTGSIFTARFRRHNRIIGGLVLTGAGVGPFVAGLIALTYVLPQPHGPVAIGITIVCFLLAGLLPWRAIQHMSLGGNAYLRDRLAEKLSASGEDITPGAEKEFVGFSPGKDLLSWEGETDRDVGFLCEDEGALIYRGDEYCWTLRRQAIDSIKALSISGGPQRIVITWRATREPGRALTLASREARTLAGANQATQKLLHRLQEWKQRVSESEEQSPILGLPPTDTAGGYPMEQAPKGSCATLVSVGVVVTLSIWLVAPQLITAGYYYHGILWAGLIAVGGAMFATHFLAYLQTYEVSQKGS